MNTCKTVVRTIVMMALPIGVSLSAIGQTSTSLDADWGDLHEFRTSNARDAGVVGSSMMLLYDGEMQSAFYGAADSKTGREVDEETIHRWASITKTFTGIAIMQLRDEGLLTLDDAIDDYLPELAAGRGHVTVYGNPF